MVSSGKEPAPKEGTVDQNLLTLSLKEGQRLIVTVVDGEVQAELQIVSAVNNPDGVFSTIGTATGGSDPTQLVVKAAA